MIIKLRKDGKTVIVVSGSINHKYFLDRGFTDRPAHSLAPAPDPESISDPLEQEQDPKKPTRRTRKKKTGED